MEYEVFDLDYLAVDYLFPLVKEHMKLWCPMKNPRFGTDVFSELKEALEASDRPNMEQGTPVDVYHRWAMVIQGLVRVSRARWSEATAGD